MTKAIIIGKSPVIPSYGITEYHLNPQDYQDLESYFFQLENGKYRLNFSFPKTLDKCICLVYEWLTIAETEGVAIIIQNTTHPVIIAINQIVASEKKLAQWNTNLYPILPKIGIVKTNHIFWLS